MSTCGRKTLISDFMVLVFFVILLFQASAVCEAQISVVPTIGVSTSPSVVGVGETITLFGDVHPGAIFQGLIFEVTIPDGRVETLGPFVSDQDGKISCSYTTYQIGTHALTCHFPEQTLSGGGTYRASDSEEITFIVQETPVFLVASFTSSHETRVVNEQVTFDASGSSDSDGTIVDYVWDFGDGNSGAGMTVIHSYSLSGTYTVTLTVTDNDGVTNVATKTITVTAGTKSPTASFTYSPDSPEVGETVNFDASSSSDTDGYIAHYAWFFGDGDENTAPDRRSSPNHTYSKFGTYNVTLLVTDNDGLIDQVKKTITVTEASRRLYPVASFTCSPDSPEVGETVNFDASSSSDTDGTIVSYFWDFGDGTTGAGMTTSHSYSSADTYTVTLTVTDNDGIADNTTQKIVLTEMPPPSEDGSFPYWILIPIIIAIIVAVIVLWFFFFRKRKPKEKVPEPTKIRVTVNPNELLADGKSKSSIVIELLDAAGKPVSALSDTEIKLNSTMGKIEQPLTKIPKGKGRGQSVLVSSKNAGQLTLSAQADGLQGSSITLTFVAKKRYCMHCSYPMSFAAKKCPRCGKSPPAGVDTKICKKCEAVIPAVAKYCPKCGTNQAKTIEY